MLDGPGRHRAIQSRLTSADWKCRPVLHFPSGSNLQKDRRFSPSIKMGEKVKLEIRELSSFTTTGRWALFVFRHNTYKMSAIICNLVV
jgi:hypothetical protein